MTVQQEPYIPLGEDHFDDSHMVIHKDDYGSKITKTFLIGLLAGIVGGVLIARFFL